MTTLTRNKIHKFKDSARLSYASNTAIAILAVDNIHVDADDRNRLKRLDSGAISHEEAIQEVAHIAKQLSAKM